MSDAPPSPDAQDRLRSARRAALLKRYLKGQRLSAEDLKELKGILPDAVIERARIKRSKFDKQLKDYVDTYGREVRALKDWIAIGRKADPPDAPPLDRPWLMAAWWRRNKIQVVPDDLQTLEAKGEAPPAASTETNAVPVATVAPVPSPALAPSSPATAAAGVGFLASLQRQRTAEAATGEIYNALLAAASAADLKPEDRARRAAVAESARRSWDADRNALREMERDAEKILSAANRTWLSDDVVASHEIIHLVVKEGVFGLLRRTRPKLKACANVEAEDKLWQDEVEKLFAILRASKFTVLPDEAA